MPSVASTGATAARVAGMAAAIRVIFFRRDMRGTTARDDTAGVRIREAGRATAGTKAGETMIDEKRKMRL